jgi:uncharacterized membrane protein YfcA
VAAAIGTLIGAGGGFVLVPVLLALFPNYPPTLIVGVSLVVVLCNSISATIAYLRMRRVDLLVAGWFAAATIPGAIAGAVLLRVIGRQGFERLFGLFLLALSMWLLVRPGSGAIPPAPGAWTWNRELVDSEGVRHVYAVSMRQGVLVSLGVGCASSLFGIGGGVIHVPASIVLLRLPVLIAVATSQFILMITSVAGTITHVALGHLSGGGPLALWLALGAVPGAQFGAALSKRIETRWIVRVLAAALMLTGLRLVS